MSNNGDKEPEVRRKKCPFLGEYCIKGACALNIELAKNMGGVVQKLDTCAFEALVIMMSEMNVKATVSQQKIAVPRLFRG